MGFFFVSLEYNIVFFTCVIRVTSVDTLCRACITVEEWLKGQVETAQQTIKLLEHKQQSPQPSKRGLLGRLLGAINND